MIRPIITMLSLLTLASSVALAQHDASPRRTMQPFGSQNELVQFFAALDRDRLSRLAPPAVTCTDSAVARGTKNRYVITGRVQSSAGAPVASAQVTIAGLGVCALTSPDGHYRFVIPRKRLGSDSTVTVTAAFIGYRRGVQTVKLRRRGMRADFVLTENPLQLQELVTQSLSGGVASAGESITNTQHAGVDEGGIVKLHGEHLVILRRGRLFTVSVGDAELRPVDMVDAFPPGSEPAEWYDELLVAGDRVIVIGYSYRRGGTEVGLFDIDRDGGLRHVSTSHLRSNDYYSSRNYASRLVGGKLVYYTPLLLNVGADPLARLPALREWRPGPTSEEFERIVTPRRVYRPARSLAGSEYLTLHTITQCNVGGPRLECEASVVIGPDSRVFYVSPGSVYVWSSDWPWHGDDRRPAEAVLYRLPLDGSAPTGIAVGGSPVDQFSFLESDDEHLNVVVQAYAAGDAMWNAEWNGRRVDSMALLRVPLAELDDGRAQAPQSWYRALPSPAGGVFHNRFVGAHLLYGAGNGWWRPTRDSSTAFVVPWKGGEVTQLGLPHGVDRIEVMGDDAVVVGAGGGNLHFSGVRLGSRPVVVQRFVMENASQGELRSHGFFYKVEDKGSGILGLPVRGGVQPGYSHLSEGSASVAFLRNEGRRLSRLGSLASRPDVPVNDGCKASCVDWYGNARPLFLRGRIFALLGYELVEGALETDGIREIQRASFAPAAAPRTVGH